MDDCVTTTIAQYIDGEKTFSAGIIAFEFAKTDKDNTSVLLVGRGDMLLSAY